MTNISVIGTGYWGKNLVRNFNELGVLHTICDSNPSTLNSFQKQYPKVEVQRLFQNVLQNPDIDAVVIATPAETHFKMAKMALLANKHVFVEKPLALFVNEARGTPAVSPEPRPEVDDRTHTSLSSCNNKTERDSKFWRTWKDQLHLF